MADLVLAAAHHVLCLSRDEIQYSSADLLGRGSCPSTGQSAARTSRVLDQIVSA